MLLNISKLLWLDALSKSDAFSLKTVAGHCVRIDFKFSRNLITILTEVYEKVFWLSMSKDG